MWFFFFFKQKTAYEIMPSLVGSEMCIRDRDQKKSQEDPILLQILINNKKLEGTLEKSKQTFSQFILFHLVDFLIEYQVMKEFYYEKDIKTNREQLHLECISLLASSNQFSIENLDLYLHELISQLSRREIQVSADKQAIYLNQSMQQKSENDQCLQEESIKKKLLQQYKQLSATLIIKKLFRDRYHDSIAAIDLIQQYSIDAIFDNVEKKLAVLLNGNRFLEVVQLILHITTYKKNEVVKPWNLVVKCLGNTLDHLREFLSTYCSTIFEIVAKKNQRLIQQQILQFGQVYNQYKEFQQVYQQIIGNIQMGKSFQEKLLNNLTICIQTLVLIEQVNNIIVSNIPKDQNSSIEIEHGDVLPTKKLFQLVSQAQFLSQQEEQPILKQDSAENTIEDQVHNIKLAIYNIFSFKKLPIEYYNMLLQIVKYVLELNVAIEQKQDLDLYLAKLYDYEMNFKKELLINGKNLQCLNQDRYQVLMKADQQLQSQECQCLNCAKNIQFQKDESLINDLNAVIVKLLY
eukprot:TRINITY_DN15057_c0_g1_i2.p1 TRINITY_DN15057_c0_g1~~TRINITY_DN15057_c0_g1_i2.p1  ORF type:complete len:518 (+),score=93.90 TRINITY_DN15057_c0_g1_i2:47-1600(+)